MTRNSSPIPPEPLRKKTGRMPWLQFYPQDYLGDAGVSMLSQQAECVWFRLLCLIHQGGVDGSITAHPSALARHTKCANKEEFAERMTEIRESGVAEVQGVKDGAYTITCRRMRRDEARRSADRERKRAGIPGGGSPESLRNSKTEAQKPRVTTPIPPSKGAELLAPQIREVFAHYRKYHPQALAPATTKKGKLWKLVEDRLKEGFIVENLTSAIDGNHKSPYHCGENETKTKYHGLDLILRDSAKIERFIDADREFRAAPQKREDPFSRALIPDGATPIGVAKRELTANLGDRTVAISLQGFGGYYTTNGGGLEVFAFRDETYSETVRVWPKEE